MARKGDSSNGKNEKLQKKKRNRKSSKLVRDLLGEKLVK
jgi:hypothetical protein